MPRKLRLEFEGAVYHVISRGNYRADVFGHESTKSGGEIDRIKREAFEPRCRELIVASLDAFSGRSKTQPSAFDRLSDKTEKAFCSAKRFSNIGKPTVFLCVLCL